MATILCYGDSNTWGWDPVTKGRLPRDVRWPGALRDALGEGFEVIEEGLNGRTTLRDDPTGDGKNGRTYLQPCLETHAPLDLVVLMLGTNDLKARFDASAWEIAESAGLLVTLIQRSQAGIDGGAPKVLLVAPAPVTTLTELAEMFEGAREKSLDLGRHYATIAGWRGCGFLDAGAVIASSDLDGIHLEAAEHRKLGLAIAAKVRELLG